MNKLKLLLIMIAVVFLTTACENIGLGTDGTAPIISPVSNGLNIEPICNTNYDIYLGRVGAFGSGTNDASIPGTSTGGYDLLNNIEAAENSFISGHGVGAGTYVFLGGPQVGATLGLTPTQWGALQANWATQDYNSAEGYTTTNYHTGDSFLFIMGDVEPSGGWYPEVINNGVVNVAQTQANVAANQEVWTAFVNALQSAGTNVLLYSSPNTWGYYFNPPSPLNPAPTGSYPVNTAEDTYENDYGPVTNSSGSCPTGDTNSSGPGGYSAAYFDTITATDNLIWQWAQGPNAYSGGDFDLIDISNYNTLFSINDNP